LNVTDRLPLCILPLLTRFDGPSHTPKAPDILTGRNKIAVQDYKTRIRSIDHPDHFSGCDGEACSHVFTGRDILALLYLKDRAIDNVTDSKVLANKQDKRRIRIAVTSAKRVPFHIRHDQRLTGGNYELIVVFDTGRRYPGEDSGLVLTRQRDNVAGTSVVNISRLNRSTPEIVLDNPGIDGNQWRRNR
jgi:hypothetical protein